MPARIGPLIVSRLNLATQRGAAAFPVAAHSHRSHAPIDLSTADFLEVTL